MTAETPTPSGPDDSVELPRPTAWPLVLSLGVALAAAGVVTGPAFLLVGPVVCVAGLVGWSGELMPGAGHVHEPLAEPAHRPRPVTGAPGTVERLQAGRPGYRLQLPQRVHPISAGLKGG